MSLSYIPIYLGCSGNRVGGFAVPPVFGGGCVAVVTRCDGARRTVHGVRRTVRRGVDRGAGVWYKGESGGRTRPARDTGERTVNDTATPHAAARRNFARALVAARRGAAVERAAPGRAAGNRPQPRR